MKHLASGLLRVSLLLGLFLSQGKAADYFFAHSAGTYNFNYYLWKLNPTDGSVVQTLISGVPVPVGGMAYFGGHLWAHSAGTYNLSYRLWKINPTNGSVVQTLTSGVTAPVGGMAYANGYFWAHSANASGVNYLLWKINPANGSVVQTLTSGVTLPVGALAHGGGYLWAHSSGTYNFNYVLWKINPASGNVVQTLTSAVAGPIGGLVYADGYLWAHSAGAHNFNYVLWKINPANGSVVQTLISGVSLPVGALTFLEGTPPTGSVAVNGGASFATSASVNLSLSASDNAGTVSLMRFSNDNSAWSPWEPYGTNKVWTLASGDGGKTVSAQFQDDTGNTSNPYSDSITLDTIAPTGSMLINGGAVMTTDLSVALALNAADAGSGTSQMRFSNDGSGWSEWEAYSTSKVWVLTWGDGNKTTYVQFKDTAGNVSLTFSDTILFYMNGGVPTSITVLRSGNSLELSWPVDHTGWRLQVQIGSLSSNWINWPERLTTNRVSVPIVPGRPAAFYRIVYP